MNSTGSRFAGGVGRSRHIVAIGGLALLLAAGLVGVTESSAQGLKLDTAVEKVLDGFDKPNPHFELACSECHGAEKPGDKATWETVKFVNGDAGNVALCLTCHDASENIHPINMDPTKGTPPVAVPAEFPLERIGAHAGEVVCSTCHFIHAKTAGLKLLRGFPESAAPEDVAKAKFTDRRDLCKSCHKENLKEKSPHKGKVVNDQTRRACAFCHAKEPKEGEQIVFTKNPVELCDFCHAATKGGHYLLVNPFADPNLVEEIKKTAVPLHKGEYTCVSCHNPHGGTGEEKFLRKEFVQLALKSTRVRPHFMKAFCEACHTVRPKARKGTPEAQKLAEIPLRDNDINKLCDRCHESGLSKANAHPLRAVKDPIKGKMPADWPLAADGGLTCLTCHTPGDADTMDPKNPTFLRGAPYESRNGMCWKCHDQAEFAKLNPHNDINEGKGCEFCHATRPDRNKSAEIKDVKFKGDIVMLCIRCHDALPHPASKNHVGPPRLDFMKEKNINIPKDFPLDVRGRLTCATCHNPHAGGSQRGVVVGMEICGSCHPY